jgi:hypothetical protein
MKTSTLNGIDFANAHLSFFLETTVCPFFYCKMEEAVIDISLSQINNLQAFLSKFLTEIA